MNYRMLLPALAIGAASLAIASEKPPYTAKDIARIRKGVREIKTPSLHYNLPCCDGGYELPEPPIIPSGDDLTYPALLLSGAAAAFAVGAAAGAYFGHRRGKRSYANSPTIELMAYRYAAFKRAGLSSSRGFDAGYASTIGLDKAIALAFIDNPAREVKELFRKKGVQISESMIYKIARRELDVDTYKAVVHQRQAANEKRFKAYLAQAKKLRRKKRFMEEIMEVGLDTWHAISDPRFNNLFGLDEYGKTRAYALAYV